MSGTESAQANAGGFDLLRRATQAMMSSTGLLLCSLHTGYYWVISCTGSISPLVVARHLNPAHMKYLDQDTLEAGSLRHTSELAGRNIQNPPPTAPPALLLRSSNMDLGGVSRPPLGKDGSTT
ncbi:unnamed protein product, partial [Clonostachys solani]